MFQEEPAIQEELGREFYAWSENVADTAQAIASLRIVREELSAKLSGVDKELAHNVRRLNDLGEQLNEWAARDAGALK